MFPTPSAKYVYRFDCEILGISGKDYCGCCRSIIFQPTAGMVVVPQRSVEIKVFGVCVPLLALQ